MNILCTRKLLTQNEIHKAEVEGEKTVFHETENQKKGRGVLPINHGMDKKDMVFLWEVTQYKEG